MLKRKVDGLSIKAGPTHNGFGATPIPVSGELLGIDVVSVFLSRYWPLLLLLLIPFVFALYSKRNAIPKWMMRLMLILRQLRHTPNLNCKSHTRQFASLKRAKGACFFDASCLFIA